MSNLEELDCCVDDFCQKFIPLWHQQLIENGLLKRRCEASLSLSEVMTLLIISLTQLLCLLTSNKMLMQ
nr:hypothetical protein [Photorhabdus sp. CRI-LC]